MLSFSRSSNPWDNQKFSRPVIDGGLHGSRKKVFRERSGSLRVRAARSSTKRAIAHPVASICSITNTTGHSIVCLTICPLQALVPVDLPLQGSSKRINLDQITHYTEAAKTLAPSEFAPRSSQSRWIGPTLRSGATCRDSPGGSKELPGQMSRPWVALDAVHASSFVLRTSLEGALQHRDHDDDDDDSGPNPCVPAAPTRVCLREKKQNQRKKQHAAWRWALLAMADPLFVSLHRTLPP